MLKSNPFNRLGSSLYSLNNIPIYTNEHLPVEKKRVLDRMETPTVLEQQNQNPLFRLVHQQPESTKVYRTEDVHNAYFINNYGLQGMFMKSDLANILSLHCTA